MAINATHARYLSRITGVPVDQVEKYLKKAQARVPESDRTDPRHTILLMKSLWKRRAAA